MDELLIRQAPHSPEAEQAVLGSMLIDADCVKDVMDKLQPEDFYLRRNREIFETIYSMFVYSKPIDGVTVAGEMERAGLSTDDTRSYLVQLMEVTPTSANVMEYVRIVREKALLRAVAAAASDITAMVQEGAGRRPRFWRRRSRRSMPSAGAAAPRTWCPSAWCCNPSWSGWESLPPPAERLCRG